MPSGMPSRARFLKQSPQKTRNAAEPRTAVMSMTLMFPNERGVIVAEAPSMSSMLEMLEPSMFPSASWDLFFAAATTQVASSGRDVPPARIVIAMNFS